MEGLNGGSNSGSNFDSKLNTLTTLPRNHNIIILFFIFISELMKYYIRKQFLTFQKLNLFFFFFNSQSESLDINVQIPFSISVKVANIKVSKLNLYYKSGFRLRHFRLLSPLMGISILVEARMPIRLNFLVGDKKTCQSVSRLASPFLFEIHQNRLENCPKFNSSFVYSLKIHQFVVLLFLLLLLSSFIVSTS